MKIPLSLSIGYLNIHELDSKWFGCKLPLLSNQITHAIMVLSETWKCDHSKNIEGYSYFEIEPQKLKGKSGRASGGIIVYYKTFLEPHIEVLKRSTQYAWIKISQNIFNNIMSDIYLCAGYKPPISS